MSGFAFPIESNYYLVPGMPTPNGRIHLGHIAGPYLKMDVLKRKVRRNNGVAFLCSGSDVYESYVELKAFQLSRPPAEIAGHFHKLIIKDFEALDIDFDLYINPLEDDLSAAYSEFTRSLLQALVDRGLTVERDESIPYDEVKKAYLTGCWIKGICPQCNTKTGSYLCEKCGSHYRPMDIFDQKDYPDAKLIDIKVLYLKVDKDTILTRVARVQDGMFKEILEKYFERQGPFIRLTTLQQTGVPFSWNNTTDQVIFTYTSLLFFAIFCGGLLQDKYSLETNPMAANSNFVSCVSFGFDNIVPSLAGFYGTGALLPGYKPFDYYFPNFFYSLNGEKFSTSRAHLISGEDIVERSKIPSDAIRYFLCKVNPEMGPENLDTDRFIGMINHELYTQANAAIRTAFDLLMPDRVPEPDECLLSQMESIIKEQDDGASPDRFKCSSIVKPIDEWICQFEQYDADQRSRYSYWWLKALAYLSYPIMPRFATSLWRNLTGSNVISSNAFFESGNMISKNLDQILFREISYEDLNKSLPVKTDV